MTLHYDSLAAKLRLYFAENPGEELTYADIAVKFDTTVRNARTTVGRLKALGLVESIHVVRAKQKREKA